MADESNQYGSDQFENTMLTGTVGGLHLQSDALPADSPAVLNQTESNRELDYTAIQSSEVNMHQN